MFVSLEGIKKSPLSLRMIFYMFVLSLVVILVSALIQAFVEFRQGKQAIQNNLELIESSYLQPLAISTYNINEQLTKIQLKGLIELDAIVYAEIVEPRGTNEYRLETGNPEQARDIERVYPLQYRTESNVSYPVGTLLVAANFDELREQIKDRISSILLENLLRTMLIALIMLFVTRAMITRHLSKIADFTDSVNLDRLDQALLLDRKQGKRFHPDELDQIVTAVNNLRLRLVQDIAERAEAEKKLVKSEEEYRGLFERVPIGLYRTNRAGKILDVNPVMVEMLGYPSKDSLLSVNTRVLYVDPEKRESDIAHRLINETINRFEIQMIRYDGTEIWVWEAFQSVRNDDGEIMLEGSLEDVTEHKQIETALRRSQKMEAIGQLTGGIAHDFNNILGIILGNVDLLPQLIENNDAALKRVDVVRKSAERAADLTRQLLSVSRNQPALVEVTDINMKITEMESLIEHSVTPGVSMEHNYAGNLWLTGIDPGDFEDALINLIINARDAMSSGGRLTIETNNTVLDEAYCIQNPSATPGEYIQLAVSDNGIGISHEQQEHVFEPFYTTKTLGTGMGLAMVFGFVKRSGGHIKIYSELGIGTTIRLYLPRVEGENLVKQPLMIKDSSLPRGTETLLAVDDEEELLELAHHTLQALGYRVLTALDGQQALELIGDSDEVIDLLFSDVVMPGGINGYELADLATTSRPNLKVLLTSGFTERAIAHNGQARFNANLLDKPYTQVELAQKLRALLDETKVVEKEGD